MLLIAYLTPALGAIAGCALAPGMEFDERGGLTANELPSVGSQADGIGQVPVTAIDAHWVMNQPDEGPRGAPAVYVIGAGDVLGIYVWDHPELNILAHDYSSVEAAGQVVEEDGKIFFPAIGRVAVAGLTVARARELLTARLSTFLTDPQLDVSVLAYRSRKVFVLGEVRNPAPQYMTAGRMTLAEAIANAGGINPVTSNPARIYLFRSWSTEAMVYQLDAGSPDALLIGDRFALEPRDLVFVSASGVTRWNRVIQQLLPTRSVVNDLQ
jgi:protein involved in polysaccharide export with SLBB domain